MIRPWAAAGIVLASGWHGVVLLAGRAEGLGLATTLALAAALAVAVARSRHSLSPSRLATALLAMAAAGLTGIALLQIGALVVALLLCTMPSPRWPLVALALLALPVLPSLDLLLAWPLRRISALITVGLLRLNGIGVGLEGIALQWHGEQLLFDGPCSGVRMLWAMLVLASLVAAVQRSSAWRFARLLAISTAVAVAGNALRAASLFYLETGFVPIPGGAVAHEVVGLAAFALLAGATLLVATRSQRAAA